MGDVELVGWAGGSVATTGPSVMSFVGALLVVATGVPWWLWTLLGLIADVLVSFPVDKVNTESSHVLAKVCVDFSSSCPVHRPPTQLPFALLKPASFLSRQLHSPSSLPWGAAVPPPPHPHPQLPDALPFQNIATSADKSHLAFPGMIEPTGTKE